MLRVAARLRRHRGALVGDRLRGPLQQRRRLAVHARHRGIARRRLEAGRLERVEPAPVTLAHRRVRAHELLDERAALAGRQLVNELRGERVDRPLARLERLPILVELVGLLAAQQRVLPFLHLQLELDERGRHEPLLADVRLHVVGKRIDRPIENVDTVQRATEHQQQRDSECEGNLVAQLHGTLNRRGTMRSGTSAGRRPVLTAREARA